MIVCMTAAITGQDVDRMTRHWLKRPAGSYYGCGYGNDLKSVLFTPFLDGRADDQITKLKEDVPVHSMLPDGAVSLYSVNTPPDRTDIVLEVAGRMIALEG